MTNFGGSTQRYPRSVVQFPIINNDDPDKFHPTQKPIQLVEYFIKTYTPPDSMVLDNVAGSGTTAIAAHRLGRKWTCIEHNQKYFDQAIDRLERHGLIRT